MMKYICTYVTATDDKNVCSHCHAIHDTVHEMARDEVSHGRGLEGLLKRYF